MTEQNRATAAGPELRPAPVFAVGISGHRSIGAEGATAAAVEADLAKLVGDLSRATQATVAAAPDYFAPGPPLLRVVTMAADGADLLGARVARAAAADLNLI